MAMVLVGWASTADARIVERGEYSFSDSFTDELCGDTAAGPLTVEVEAEYAGRFQVRGDIPGSTAYLSATLSEFREVITNPETGKWLVVRGRTNSRDVTSTHVEGDIYRYRVQAAGQPFVVEDSNGKVVLRESGLLVYELVWETLSVDPYRGQLIDFEFVSAHGRFPAEEDVFCQTVVALIG
jgi:hypothetical protein